MTASPQSSVSTHLARKYFGTDGIRSRVGTGTINPEFVLKLGWAVGRVLANRSGKKVLIGKDTRISGYMLESALEAGLSAAGIDIVLLGPMPTPAIAYLTRTFRADAGIVISASHNPYYDNGIKFFSAQGTKLEDSLELEIETYLLQAMTTVESIKLGKATRMDDAPGRYIEFCKRALPTEISLKGLKIVLDCANGATYHIAPNVFRELGAEVIELGVDPDGLNINAQCGSTKPEILQNIVVMEKADLGIAFDGDGDRVLMVDHTGDIVDGDELLYIMAYHQAQQGRLRGGVVGTIMSNLGLEHSLAALGIDFVRASVGDRYVLGELEKRRWELGGEASGHLMNLKLSTTGDGIIAALQVLWALQDTGITLYQFKSKMQKFPQKQFNIRTDRAVDVFNSHPIQAAIRQCEMQLGSTGRVILRPSGTEPVLRIMVEADDMSKVEQVGSALASMVVAILEKRSDN